MSTLLAALDRLADAFGTNFRIAMTIAAVGFLLAVLLSYRRIQGWLNERTKPLYSDILSTAILIGTCVLSLTVVLSVWELTDDIYTVYSEELGLGEGVIVQAAVTFILVIGTLILTRFVKRLLNEVLGSASAVTDHQREITHRVSQVIIWSVSLVVISGVWVDDLGGLLVGAGFLGIVVGIAAQQTLGTVLSGFVLMFDRPFEIGDWIEVEGYEGIVTDISIVNTRIQSFDGEYIMVPNDVISSSMVTNRSKRGRLRVEIDVGVDYESDPERAADLARETVEELDAPLTAPSPQVVTKEFGDSAVVLGVRFWIDNPSARRYTRARTAAIHEIKSAFEDAGITIPYPQRELSGRAETGGFRISSDRAHAESNDSADRTTETNPNMPTEDD
ncbi:mechanosensitive ion channel family protein [Natronolimnohabitans sp. A-GB9]|uniref:mechanosensitive ion channel family protein n=1 Tax=Natronolimnohabitans sp. A-GB9 TaxID=3069757 RepID=UPI0027AE2401|nr:mechanosensitive ion channel family protein [Natronolimnohabitans sp. A-GB9]MDQ2049590.1 mechanosensitive ion channel family protein [Natronolimnohabitans sp. A-GB9]